MGMTRVQLDAALNSSRMPEMETLLDGRKQKKFAGRDDWSISLGQFWSGISANVEVVEICNGPLCVNILPTRGMGLWNARFNDLPIGWNSPVKQPVHPKYVNLNSRNGLGWLDGFNELLCRCGLAFNGPPGHDEGAASPIESELTLHGRISNLPARDLEFFADDDTGVIGVSGIVDECTLFGPQLQLKSTISTTIGSSSFLVEDEITNLSADSTDLQLLYHTNIGTPFLDAGAQLECAANRVVPRDSRAAEGITKYATCLGPTPGYAEQVYYFHLLSDDKGETQTLLRNQAGSCGLSLKFNTAQLPCFAFWKCTQDERNGYVAGLEPATNYPNFKTFERHHGRVISLAPGATYSTRLEFTVHDSPESVNNTISQIRELQRERQPQVSLQPVTPFCPID
ncbi:MAG TPA: aldose 1-epimerase family protein [Planctomicrobium sp.]|nr:aldose 1-epimerase family protein [Planctomicrobium sp.]